MAEWMRRNGVGVVTGAVLVAVVAATVFASVLAPYAPGAQDLMAANQGPSPAHPLGTDMLGRDVYSRLLYGGQVTLPSVAIAVLSFFAVGTILGILAGYFRGLVDATVSRVVEINFAIPGVIIALVVLAVSPSNTGAALFAVGVMAGIGYSRVVRAVALGVGASGYVEAAKVTGVSTPRILIKHVLPRTIGLAIIQSSIFVGVALILESGLAFMGFGPPAPTPSWGSMIADASKSIGVNPWLLVPTGATIIVTVIAAGLFGTYANDVIRRRCSPETAGRRAAAVAPGSRLPREANAPVDRQAAISVRGLTVSAAGGAGRVEIVQNLDLDLHRGEVLAIVGESGSGKSITALAILDLLPPAVRVDRGIAVVDGVDTVTASRRRVEALRGRTVALISQEPLSSLDPTFTVRSLLTEAVRTHRGRSVDALAEARRLLEAVLIPDPDGVLARYPHQLSGGMAQRVAIAIALAGEPDILVADEPTTALDVTVQREVLGVLQKLRAERGLSILLITHDLGVVADVCDRVLTMYAGQVVEVADVFESFAAPLHPYTAALQRANPHSADAAGPLPAIAGTVPRPQDWPLSCRFADRCAFARVECRAGPVPLTIVRDRSVRCVRAEEFAAAGVPR